MMIVLVYLMVCLGVGSSALHLATARPRNPFSPASLNANGWVAIVLLAYLRSLGQLMLSGADYYQGPVDFNSIYGLVTGYLVDAAIIYRMISYRRYRSAYRQRQSETAQAD